MFISLAVFLCILADLFSLNDKFTLAALCGFTVTSPVILMLFGYVHFVPSYFPGVILVTAAGFVLCKHEHNFRNFAIGTLLLCLGTGVYQCFFPLGLSIMLLYLINQTETQNMSWPQYWQNALYFLASGVIALLLYLVINSLFISALKIFIPSFSGMSAYAGLDHWGFTSITGYLFRLAKAYGRFILMLPRVQSVFVAGSRYMYFILLITSAILVFKQFTRMLKTSGKSALQFMMSVMLLPLSVNLMNLMTDTVHALHMLTWVIAVIFILQRPHAVYEESSRKYMRKIVITLLILSNIITARYDNNCYVKLEIYQSQAVQYFTTLITRIKSLEGYNDELPVIYLNEFDKDDKSLPNISHIDDSIPTYPYSFTIRNLVNNYAWKNFMLVWCGYAPQLYESENSSDAIKSYAENMPHYPDDGSIRIIDGVVVVNF